MSVFYGSVHPFRIMGLVLSVNILVNALIHTAIFNIRSKILSNPYAIFVAFSSMSI